MNLCRVSDAVASKVIQIKIRLLAYEHICMYNANQMIITFLGSGLVTYEILQLLIKP